MIRPQRIAALARALGPELCERLALNADLLAASLERDLGLVAWDREQLIGQMQARQWELREERFSRFGGAPLCVVERRLQPLEALEPVWRGLRMGRAVRLDHEAGAPAGLLDLVRAMGRAVGSDLLTVSDVPVGDGTSRAPDGWEFGGVGVASPRAALVDGDADAELAAYVLARGCLRRSGMDPRAVRLALVMGRRPRLERHLCRLWLGARFGAAADPSVFAGPVDALTRDAYLEACQRWAEHAQTTVLCEGGMLEQAGVAGIFVAPTLVRTTFPAPSLPVAGPLLVVVEGDDEQCRRGFAAAVQGGAAGLHIAGGVRREAGTRAHTGVRLVQGALLVDRLLPGLPEPRPV